METQLDVRKKEHLIASMNKADIIVQKKYLAQLANYEVIPVAETIRNIELNKIARFYKLEQFVFDKMENTRDKLVSVFQSVAAVGASLVVLINSSSTEIDYYIGVRSIKKNPAEAHEILYKSLCANFPGISFKTYKDTAVPTNYSQCILSKSDIEQVSEDVFAVNKLNAGQQKSIASITGIAGLRAEQETQEQKFVQGIEKVIDAMRGERYSLLLIAEPIPTSEVQTIKRGYENLYSAIKPFENTVLTYGENESESVTATYSHGITDTINHSITNTITQTEGRTYSTTHTESGTKGFSIGLGLGGMIPPVGIFGNAGFNKSHTSGISSTEGTNSSRSNAYGTTEGTSKGVSETKSDATTKGTGASRTLQISFENKAVKKMMDTIDAQLERIDTAGSVGMWSCAAYCIADTPIVSEMAAAAYYSVIRGEDSYLETGAITQWSGSNLVQVADYLKKMLHPIVDVNGSEMPAASFISTKELAIHAGFPEKSVAGLPVRTVASFGREVVSSVTDNGINCKLGTVYHIGKEENKIVCLNTKSLASHTFITGSTGSGKSNTIYQILTEAKKSGCTFLVIEPAKGEYKHIFGMQDGVAVYGTNPALTPLLCVNPFKFPKGIHILEHLDRLVEIFNVCWPMYAAMPAVLKEAVARSYQDAGWDLTESKNPYGENLYPSFADVVRNVRIIIDSSDYDAENKGAYKGSLITRLRSLTNGLNGLIFTNDAITDSDLFDKNVIVDLSRVGSTETKSLIMGILVMQLQEYRMTSGRLNADLMHVTVLEEAHHLLKRTAMEQSNETANLLGKSVEMLGNAIAEMRTYGEGFIIADQAPGLLDMAVIRNTNTKIIMRLPDLSDRELVGKAAGLNDDQIIELGKLPLGVAAVYQNDWIEPVLCKVAHHRTAEQHYAYTKPLEEKQPQIYTERLSVARFLCNPDSIGPAEKTRLTEIIRHLNIRAVAVVQLQKYIHEPPKMPRFTKIAPIISALFPEIKQAFTESFSRTDDGEQWSRDVDETIQRILHLNSEEQLSKDIRQCIITDYLHNELGKTELLEKWSKEGGIN
jgi:hypothetical protein